MHLALKNIRLLILLISLLITIGFSSLSTLPIAEDPVLTNRWSTITTVYPGASAERVEALVTEKLESLLRSLSEIKTLSSLSKPGVSIISIELNDNVKNTELVWSKIRDKLNDAVILLPSDIQSPSFDNDHSNAFTYITALRWKNDKNIDPLLLNRYSKELIKRWQNLPGTEFVDSYGEPEEEILVKLNNAETSQLGQSAISISNAIKDTDVKKSAGVLNSKENRLQIEIFGELDSIDRIKRVPVITNSDGQLIRIEDIASVTRTQSIPINSFASISGKQVILISARMHNDTRINKWTELSDEMLDNFRKELPDNMELIPIFKQDKYTNIRLVELVKSLFIGLIIIVIVLFITLGFRAATLVAISLPITSAFTLGLMYFIDLPINQMSVTGLIVSLGITVDNAIVMVDIIQHYRRQGHKPLESAMRAIKHLWLPLLGSTLTTVLAFAPIFLMPGAAGEFVGDIAITVCFSLIGSYIVSHVLVSGLSIHWLSNSQVKNKWYEIGFRFDKINKAFHRTVWSAVYKPWRTLIFVSVIPLFGFFSTSQLTEQFFPPSDRDMFEIRVYLEPHSNIDVTRKITNKIDHYLKKHSQIEQIAWVHGESFPSFYYNMQEQERHSPYFAQAMIKVEDFKAANKLIPKLQKELSNNIPEAQILVRKLEQGPPFNAPLEIRVYGTDLDILQELSDKIRLLMINTPNIITTRATIQPSIPKITVNVNEESTHMVGMSLTELANLLNASMSGLVQGNIIEQTELLPVRVKVGGETYNDIAELQDLRIPIKNNEQINVLPLSAIADIELNASKSVIPHRNSERVNVIEGYITPGVLPQTVLNSFKINLDNAQLNLPLGYRIEFGGESEERNDSVNQLFAHLTIVTILLVAVVILSFNSFRLSGIIFLVAIQAAGLGLFTIWLFNYPFGFTVIIGLLGLVGLAVNGAIVILTELKTSQKAKQQNTSAIVNAVTSCGRHISSTTITTVGGFLPLILGGGGFWPPFAIVIAGGTLLTTLLSFYFVPAAFHLMYRDNTSTS